DWILSHPCCLSVLRGSVDFINCLHHWGPWEAVSGPQPSLPSSALGPDLQDPRTQEAWWGPNFWGKESVHSPRSDPSAQGPTRPGPSVCGLGDTLSQGTLFQGCVGVRGTEDRQVRAPLKPSIWADPGPMVTMGSPVTIWCQGSLQADIYHLYRDRVPQPWDTEAPQGSSNKTSFSIKSMSSHTAGLYQCACHTSWNGWSERSDPLSLVVTAPSFSFRKYRAPSLSAHPVPVAASGGNMSLSCSSEITLDTFHLLKEGGADPPQHVESRTYPGRGQPVFPVGPMNTSHGGTYRCYGSPSCYPYVWSLPSDPLHLEVTGPSVECGVRASPSMPVALLSREPSLSAQPGSLVLSGNLTLQCRSEAGFDRFCLTKVEGLTPPQRFHGQHSPDFPLGHVNHTHRGQYRCYSGHHLSYAWSAPSATLDILIAGEEPHVLTVYSGCWTQGHPWW
ncbi:hypothetical protein HPG69_013934, partial [Diceros bicornis minor]